MPYVLLLKILAVIAMAGGLVYGVHTYNDSLREQGRAEVRLEYAALLEKARSEALEKEAGWRKQQEVSNANHAKRQQVLNSNLATANLISSELRNEADSLRQLLSDPATGADAHGAAAVKTVLGECTRELEGYSTKNTELATACDRHTNDLQRYHEQWPKAGEVN